jgi:hypothetical protein
MTFGDVVRTFFRRKCSGGHKFYHKLYNALLITETYPCYSDMVGVEWITDAVIRVDKAAFARLLGIKTINGSLFHQQGNFPSHGFVELQEGDIGNLPCQAKGFIYNVDLTGVDFENVRLLRHEPGVFVRGANPEVIDQCKWINSRTSS